MKAVITGATGFIGGALAATLAESHWEVSVLVRPASRRKFSPEQAKRYHIVESDLRDNPERWRDALTACDVVFHAAAIRNRWGTSPETYHQVNVESTRRLLEAAIGRARRFVYVSSVGVLGQPGVLNIDESFPVRVSSDTSDYHSTKAEAEQLVMQRARDIEVVVVRPTITYGPDDEDGMLTRLIEMIARKRFIRVGDGRNHFHLTFINDLTRGLMLSGTHPAAPGQTFILAGPSSIEVREMIELICRLLGRAPSRLFVPESLARVMGWGIEPVCRIGAALKIRVLSSAPPITCDKVDTLCMHRGFSSAKAARLLGYVPHVGYKEGVARTIKWMVATHRLSVSQQ